MSSRKGRPLTDDEMTRFLLLREKMGICGGPKETADEYDLVALESLEAYYGGIHERRAAKDAAKDNEKDLTNDGHDL